MPRRSPTWFPPLVCALAFAACDPSSGPPDPPRPNVVIYVVDTLRADRLGAYGYDRPTSPGINRLAESSVVFEQASAPAPWTLPSVTSMLLSQLPCEHRVLVDRDRIADDARPLAVLLQEAGYRTGSFSANPYAGRMSGLDRGFELAELMVRTPKAVGRKASQWLDSLDGDAPVFLYVHTVEPHNPEFADPAFIEQLGSVPVETIASVEARFRDYRSLTRADWDSEQPLGTTDNTDAQHDVLSLLDRLKGPIDVLYDATVLEADEGVSQLIARLEELELWDDTLFILVSDHGEELGDRGGWQHDHSVYQELLHVPLLARFPGDAWGGVRVRTPVSLVDVVPTVTDYLRLARRPDVRGRSLLPLLDRDRSADDARLIAVRQNYKKYYRPYKEGRGDANFVVRQGSWKGIWNAEIDTFELYDLDSDPRELHDRSEANGELVLSLSRLARSAFARCSDGPRGSGGGEIDEEIRRGLETLGYVDPPK